MVRESTTPGFNFDEIKLQPFYYDIRNQIIQPEKVVVNTRYFWDKWVPLLGPTLAVLIIRLRRYCYYNKTTKEKRDWCNPNQRKLAREIGVSRYPIMRELERDIAEYFITREKRYVYEDLLKKKVRASDVYKIAMDDPLVPEDENKLVVMATERILKQPVADKEVRPKLQNATQVPKEPVDNLPPKSQNATHIYKLQNGTAKISTLYTTNKKNKNKEVQSVVCFFNNCFPDKKGCLREEDVKRYIAIKGKEQVILNISNLAWIKPGNPAGYLRHVFEKGDGIVRVSKNGKNRKADQQRAKKEQEWKKDKFQEWIGGLQTERSKTWELLNKYKRMSEKEQERIKRKAEDMASKRLIGFPREKEVCIYIAGIVEKESSKVTNWHLR